MSDFDPSDADLRLDCQTCVAANTTACNDCVVSHVLANDDGPIELVTTHVLSADTSLESRPDSGAVAVDIGRHRGPAVERASPPDPVADAVELLDKAGLLDDPPTWVSRAEFEGSTLTSVS